MNHPARPAVPTDRDRWVDLAIAATYALALALTLWPIQYALWLPVRYLTLITVAVVRFAVKLGAVGVLLLLLPVVGWIILAVWLVIRHQNALAERRHMQQLQAIEARDHRAHDYAETVATQTAPRSVWRPWLIDYVLEAAA